MKTALIAIILVATLIAFVMFKRRATGPSELPEFYEKKPLTAVEQVLYFRLVEALPNQIVLAQVQLSQVVGIKKGPYWQTWFNKISRKSLDFLICGKDSRVIAAIELDDKSHDDKERAVKDADKDAALNAAGIKIIRWKVKELPSVETIQQALQFASP